MSESESTSDLQRLLNLQDSLQSVFFGTSPSQLAGDERVQYIKDMILALTDELHEALGEVGWKPWATSRHVNDDAFKNELIDAWHFMLNLFLVAGMDADEIEGRYLVKRGKNATRQAAGYDGVTGKCKLCRRALDDDAVFCVPAPGPWCDYMQVYF